jgi:hypothetical protein
MGGGLIQLVARGAQDVYLTGNPQITYFKTVYRKHTNFSIDTIEQPLSSFNYGAQTSAIISRTGDLIHRMYLHLTFDPLTSVGSWGGWTNGLGNAIIDTVELEIGGQVIDKQSGEWMDIWNELSIGANKNIYDQLVGNYKSEYSLRTNGVNKKTYHIPLNFWCCRNAGNSLPLIALQYHEVKINFKFKEKNKLIIGSTAYPNGGNLSCASLYTEYIYLDTDERRRFAQNSHEYLIEQIQLNEFPITSGTKQKTVDLKIYHPVKELIWVFSKTSNATEGYNANKWLTYSASETAAITDGISKYEAFNKCKIIFNGIDRLTEKTASYFRTIQAYQHHSGNVRKHIYMYSFALKPEEHQPSGTCNFSLINQTSLNFTFESADSSMLKLYAHNYNILRITNGLGGVAYKN